MAATDTRRHLGRRRQASPKTIDKHRKLILTAQRNKEKIDRDIETQVEIVASRIASAMEHKTLSAIEVAEILGLSRQMVYKLLSDKGDQFSTNRYRNTDSARNAIKSADKKRRRLEGLSKRATTTLAVKIDRAMTDGVQTNHIAGWLGKSRQMVYKLVRERVDQIPLSDNGRGPKRERTA